MPPPSPPFQVGGTRHQVLTCLRVGPGLPGCACLGLGGVRRVHVGSEHPRLGWCADTAPLIWWPGRHAQARRRVFFEGRQRCGGSPKAPLPPEDLRDAALELISLRQYILLHADLSFTVQKEKKSKREDKSASATRPIKQSARLVGGCMRRRFCC